MNDQITETALADVLARCTPENREAFLRSTAYIESNHNENDELLVVARHMGFAVAVIGDLTACAPQSIIPSSDEVKALRNDFSEARKAANALIDVTQFHLWIFLTLAFICGAITACAIDTFISHIHIF
jgi:hypothetical protein